MAERKNPELDAQHQAILRKMMQIPENKKCADCGGPSPRWASTNLGVFLCIGCSGVHRKLGTHISQVRSITLDTWTPAQVAHFTKFGNARAAHYFEACLPDNFRRPQSSDSVNIERFIRDKYESKRFITIENGGLGGNPAPIPTSRRSEYHSGLGMGTRPFQPNTNLYHNRGVHDSFDHGKRGAPSAMSYSGRFGQGGLSSNTTSSTTQVRRTGKAPIQAKPFRASYPANPLQRAETLKQLIEMGFSAQQAASAVAAANGDLQRAVDWLLQQSHTNGNANTTPSRRGPEPKPEVNLLEFDDTTATKRSVPAMAPKAASTDVLMGVSSKGSDARKPSADFADFADFGAFESALPSIKPSSNNDAKPPGQIPLGKSIQALYKQSPPKSAPSNPEVPRMRTLHSQAIFGNIKTPLPETSHPHVKRQEVNAIPAQGSAIKASTAPEHTSPTGKPFVMPKFQWTSNEGLATSGLSKPSSFVPPPPPDEGIAGSHSNHDRSSPPPPPPESPPPPRSPEMSGHAEIQSSPEEVSQNNTQEPNASDDRPSGNANGNDVASKEPAINGDSADHDDDPFAALSMMALKSATVPVKTQKSKVELGNRAVDSIASTNATKSAAPEAIIGLDELLG